MTAQFSDLFEYRGRQFDIAGINGEGLFVPAEHGMAAVGSCTACWRGFVAGYKLEGDRLVLDNLDINLDDERQGFFGRFRKKPTLNGVHPSEDGDDLSLFQYRFTRVGLEVPFTGGFLIGSGFIDELYVHMGFHPAWKYKEVHELVFEKGKLTLESDVSERMKEMRDKLSGRGNEAGIAEPHDLMKWIDECFSRRYFY